MKDYGSDKSRLLNYKKAVRDRVFWYLIKNRIIVNKNGIKLKNAVLMFCRETGLPPMSKDDLLTVYLNGSCEFLKRGEYSFYMKSEWRNIRKIVFDRLGRLCGKCGSITNLHIDHIKPRSKYPELELDLDNLQVLCQKCNIQKSNKEEIDYRIK